MYDRDTAMLEKYDLAVRNIKKVRGGWLCIAQEGTFLWKETQSGEERLQLEAEICRKTQEKGLGQIWSCTGEAGSLRTDCFVPNQEGKFLTEDDYGRTFLLKVWTDGKECDVKSEMDLCKGAKAAACLHQIFRAVLKEIPGKNLLTVREPYEKLWQRRKKELIWVQTYVKKRRNKNQFEQIVMQKTPYFERQVQEAIGLLQNISDDEQQEICHGEFHYHNLIYSDAETWICQSNRFCLGKQISDFYVFLRKCMEKQDWNWELAEKLIHIYETYCPVSKADRQLFYCMFLFPEKYWKQMNFYVQSNKAWMPEKNISKLEKLIQQEEKRQIFLEKLAKSLEIF